MQYGYILPSQGHLTPHPGAGKSADKGFHAMRLQEPSGERKKESLGLISLAAVHSSVLEELADVSLDSFLR